MSCLHNNHLLKPTGKAERTSTTAIGDEDRSESVTLRAKKIQPVDKLRRSGLVLCY